MSDITGEFLEALRQKHAEKAAQLAREEQLEQARDKIVTAAREWREAYDGSDKWPTAHSFNHFVYLEKELTAAVDSYEALLAAQEEETSEQPAPVF